MEYMFKDMIREEPMPQKRGLVSRIQESYRRANGLGDMVADAIGVTTGIKPTKDCGCKKRKEALNKWIPFHKRK